MTLFPRVSCTGWDIGTAKVGLIQIASKSLARLENTIEPMAEKVDDMHNKLNGDLNVKISEMHHLMLSLRSMEPSPPIWASGADTWTSPGTSPFIEPKKNLIDLFPSPNTKPNRATTDPQELPTPENTPELVGGEFVSRPEQVKSMSSTSSRDTFLDRRGSDLIPVEYQHPLRSFHESPPQYERTRGGSGYSPRIARVEDKNAARRPSEWSTGSMSPPQTMLPSPAIPPERDPPHLQTGNYSFMPTTAPAPSILKGTNITASQQAMFEKFIFDDSMISCEV